MAWAYLPALYIRPVRHDAIPIGDPHRVRLGIEDISLEFSHQRALPDEVRLVQHLFVERHFVWIFELGVIAAEDRAGTVALYVEHRVRYSVAVGRRDDLEIAAPHGVEPGAGGRHSLRHLDADFLPFIDQPSADVFIRLVDVAVQQLEAEPLGTGLFQQLFRFGARLLDVGPEAGDLLQLVLGGGQRRARQDDAADGMHIGNFGQSLYAVPPVDCQGQRPSHAHVVKRLLLVVYLDEAAAVPIAFLHG